jgi:membrane-bound lytic murein transglycosylase A
VFFRITGLSDDGEAVGAQGVPLSPERSIAVDRMHVYGTPFFIQADLPIDSDKPVTKFRRLMIAQDTGSAILGPARADLYWGAGDRAGRIAGRIRQQGQFVMLLPRELDMVEAGKHMPLPEPKPTIAAVAQAQPDAKVAKADPTDKPDMPTKVGKVAKADQADKPDMPTKVGRIAKADQTDKPDMPTKVGKIAKANQADKPDMPMKVGKTAKTDVQAHPAEAAAKPSWRNLRRPIYRRQAHLRSKTGT